MKNLSKSVFLSVAVASVLAASAVAEQSGVFLGAEVGYGGASVDYKTSYSDQNLTTGEIQGGRPYTLKYNGGGVKYGIVAGYKQFFTPYLGLRYYASLSAMHASFSTTSSGVDAEWKNVSATMINYGANVDFLGNFIAQENLDFGGFVGLGIGGTSWLGKSIDDYQKFIDSYQQGWKLNKNSFDVALNVGLRANIAKNHGVEIVARVPFLATKLLDKTYQERFGGGVGGGDTYLSTHSQKTSIHHPYSITARYTFSF